MSSLHAIPLEFLIPSSIAFIISTLALIGVSLHAKVFNGAFNKGFRFLVPLNLMASDIIALVNIIVKQNQSTLLATITTSMDLVTFTAGLCYTLSFYYGMHKEDRRMSIGLTPIQLSYVLIGAQVFIGSATFVALWYFRYGPNGCETCGREVPLQVVAVMFTVLVEFYHDAKALIEIYQAKKKALSRKGYHERRTSEDNAPASLSLGRTRTLLLSLISINVAIVLAFSVVVFIFLNQPAVLRIVSGLTHPAIRIVIFNVIIFIFGVFKLMKLTEAKVGTAKLAQLPFPQTRRPYSNTDSSSGSQISAGNIEISDAQQLSPPFPRGAMYFTPHELQGVSSIGSNTEEPGLPLAYVGQRQNSQRSAIERMHSSRSNLLRSDSQDRSFYGVDSNRSATSIGSETYGPFELHSISELARGGTPAFGVRTDTVEPETTRFTASTQKN